MQLRYLQTLTDIAGDKNSTIVFPLPMDIFRTVIGRFEPKGAEPPGENEGEGRSQHTATAVVVANADACPRCRGDACRGAVPVEADPPDRAVSAERRGRVGCQDLVAGARAGTRPAGRRRSAARRRRRNRRRGGPRVAADGYTLFFGTNTAMSWVPASRKAPPYDPVSDFTAISDVGRFGFFLFTNPAVPAKTVAELLGYVRANPGKLNYGSGNSFSIMLGAQLKLAEKLDIVHVPYKGDAPLTIDLLGGRVQMAFATPGTALAQVKDGRLRALATMLPNRSPLLPDVPTAAEAGLTGVSVTAWGGLFGPARMPREVVDRLASEMAVAMKRPEVREGLDRIAFEARSSSPEELSALVKDQLEIWRRAVREVGIALE